MCSAMSPTLNSPETVNHSTSEPRDLLRGADRSRSDLLAWLIFTGVSSCYVVTLAGIYLAPYVAARAGLAVLNGLAIGMMFIVGHDACHGALTASKTLNGILGRLCLLPSLHPYTAWVYSHNGLHHSWTNLKGRDPVY